MIPDINDVPAALRNRAQWVVWRYEARNDGKPTKVPYQARYPTRRASTKDARTWSDLQTALTCAARHNFAGVGFVFADDDGFFGADFDNVIDAEGRIADWAQAWIERLGTYAEVSPSGRGVKVFGIGTLPGAGVNAGGVEVYARGRYFTFTGRRLPGAPDDLRDASAVIDAFYEFVRERQRREEQARETARRKAYAEAALRYSAERLRLAPEGMRNTTLNREAFILAGYVAGGLLDEREVMQTLADAAGTTGLPAAEIRATLMSGMRAGVAHPRDAPPSLQTRALSPAPSPNGSDAPANERPDDWLLHGVTLAQLQEQTFPPLRWVVEDILPEGACLLAAKPKSKKSWLALNLGLAVAMGGRALGRLGVDQGRVLYLDLEGNRRRIQMRTRAVLGNRAQRWPDNFHIYTDWTRGDEALIRLEHWLLMYPDTRLIVVDLLAEIRDMRDMRESAYDYDRDFLARLNRLAEQYHVAILVVHHTRKAKSDDVFEEVSGTLGINGAVAALWVLSKSPEGHTILSIIGRDIIRDDPLALRWDPILCGFTVEGTAQEVATTEARRAVLRLLDDGREWTPRQLAAELGKAPNAIQQILRDLVIAGLVDKAGYGKYVRIPGGEEDIF